MYIGEVLDKIFQINVNTLLWNNGCCKLPAKFLLIREHYLIEEWLVAKTACGLHL